MVRFEDIPVKGKLVLATVTATVAALLLSYIATVGLAIWRQRSSALRNLTAAADIVGANCLPAILFRNSRDAEELLATLREQHEIINARIYLLNGSLFAEAGLTAAAGAWRNGPLPTDSSRFDRDELRVCRPIMNGREPVGSLCVYAKLGDRWTVLREYAQISGGVMLVSLVISIFLALRLQRFVTTPLNQLATAMQTVTRDHNYVIQTAPHRGDDEIGKLVTGFNLMLVEIRERDAAIRSREAMFQGLFEQGPDAVIVVNTHGQINRVNVRAEQMFGYRRAELIGQPLDSLLPERFRRRHSGHLQRYFQSPVTRDMGAALELFGRRKDGTEFPANIGLAPLRTSDAVLALAVVADITTRKAAEEALRQSEARYHRLLTAITDYIYTVKIEHGQAVTTTHGGACEIVTGYTMADYTANPQLWYEMVHPADQAAVMAQVDSAVAGQTPPPVEHRILHKNGSVRWLRSTLVPRTDNHDTVVAYDGIMSDITERKAAEHQLQQILANSPAVIYLKDGQGRYLFVNRRYEELFHCTQADIAGKTDYDRFDKSLADQFHAHDALVLATRRPMEFEEHVSQAGSRHTYLSVKFPLSDHAGEPVAVCGISTDITERQRLQQQVQEISDRELSRIGQDLHDGLCQHLVGTAFVANRLEKNLSGLGTREAADARQVAELLDQAITQARGFARDLYPVRLEGDGLPAALEEMATRLGNRFNVDCRVFITPGVRIHETEVASNFYRIAQEAVTNAIKHAHARQVVIELGPVDGAVVLRVRDDGVGLLGNWEQSPGMGIHLMRYRANLIGATFEVGRTPDRGTLVSCVWHRPMPLEKPV